MISNISAYFYKHANIFLVALSIVLTFGYLFLFLIPKFSQFEIADATVKSLGTSFGFSAEDVTQYFKQLQPDQLKDYQKFHTIWDNLFAAIYGIQYIFILSLIFKPFQSTFKMFNLLPIVQVFLDWIENLKLAEMANAFLADGQFLASDATLASLATIAKWTTMGVVSLAIVIGLGMRIRKWIKNQNALV